MCHKKIFLSAVCIFFSFLFADDTLYGIIGENLVPVKEQETEVEMIAETIILTMYEDYYEIDVDFTFTNYGDDIELQVGFPVTYASLEAKLYDFKAWTNGLPVNREYLPISQDNGDHVICYEGDYGIEYYDYHSDFAYTIPVLFKKGTTKTRINYKNIYRIKNDSGLDWLSYYYGSGRVWKNSIGTIELIVKNYSPYSIMSQEAFSDQFNNPTIEWLDDSSYRMILHDIEPRRSDSFNWIIHDFLEKEICNDSHYLTSIDYDYYTKDQLRILRNAVYALHGYPFKSKDLSSFFARKSWYKRNPDYNDSLLTTSKEIW